jgi:hypothetical protein
VVLSQLGAKAYLVKAQLLVVKLLERGKERERERGEGDVTRSLERLAQ